MDFFACRHSLMYSIVCLSRFSANTSAYYTSILEMNGLTRLVLGVKTRGIAIIRGKPEVTNCKPQPLT